MMKVWRGRQGVTTRAAYDRNLAALARWLAQEGRAKVTGPRDTVAWLLSQGKVGAEATVLDYLQHMLDRDLCSATVKQHRSAIRSAIKTCEFLGLSAWRLEAVMSKGVERGTRRQTAGPTFEHYGAMLRAAAAQWQPKAARDVAVLRFMAELRARESEVCRLRIRDYHDGAVLLVLKGHREGVYVTVPEGVRAALADYLERRGVVAADAPLFASCDPAERGTGHLTRFGLYQLVRELARRAGLPGAVSPHRLLHTASTALTDAGHSTDDLQAWGRWEKRETAEAYTDSKQRVAERLAEDLDAMITKMLLSTP